MKKDFGQNEEGILKILKNCHKLNNLDYNAPYIMVGGVLQSAFLSLWRPVEILPRIREKFFIPKNSSLSKASCSPKLVPEGVVSIDWVYSKHFKVKGIVLIISGFTGCSNNTSVVLLADKLASNGYHAACFNPRGQGGNSLVSPFIYSAGFTEDIRYIVKYLQTSFSLPLFSAGFSMGGNCLAKYIAEEGKECSLEGCIFFGCLLDVTKTSARLGKNGITKCLDYLLTKRALRLFNEHKNMFLKQNLVDFESIKDATCLREVDAEVCKMFGCSTPTEFYRKASGSLLLSDIRIPCLFLHSKNDPLVRPLDSECFSKNMNLTQILTDKGGHGLIWHEGIWNRTTLMPDLALEYFDAIVK